MIPIQASMEYTKKKLRKEIAELKQQSGLPPFLMAAVLDSLRAELYAQELESLVGMMVKEGGDKNAESDVHAEPDSESVSTSDDTGITV